MAIGVAAAVESPGPAGAAALTGATAYAAWRRTRAGDAVVTALATLATVGMYPRVDDSPARGVTVAERRRVDPLPDGTGLVVVANPASGSGSGADMIEAIADRLPGATIRRCDPTSGDDLVDLVHRAAADGVALGVVGGDGTVNLAARAALDAGVPLVVFPGGTLNHFARDLGVDSLDDAVAAVQAGEVVAIDVGVIDDRPFLNNASIGSYSELVDERERLESRFGKWPAMVVALLRVLRRSRSVDITIDGVDRRVWMVFFGNGGYEPSGFAPSTRPDLVDGLLDVRLIDATAPLSRARLVVAVLLGALARSTVYERRLANSVSIRCADGGRSRLAADGETFDGSRAFLVGKRPAALQVHVPERDDRR
ncbi:MAG: diacylglycerol kinase family protein [Acidimicrobiales bacterium]|nr:diacylglycerol kinase family protein [Acidimicrobiales bacterium]